MEQPADPRMIGIVGGGPAGLFAALEAAAHGARVTLFERNNRPGAKLLVSGSGQCNLSHEGPLADFFKHYGDHGTFLAPALAGFPPQALCAFFSSRDCPLHSRPDGKVFPRSGRAADLLTVLERELAVRGVRRRLRERVLAVHHHPASADFSVETPSGTTCCSAVVLATGGCSWPKTGSSGDGLQLAAALGHALIPPRPALAAVRIAAHWMAPLSGIAFPNAAIELTREARVVFQAHGDVLVTHEGLSGPGILDLSRRIQAGDRLTVRPTLADPAFPARLLADAYGPLGKRALTPVLRESRLPARLVELAIESAGADGTRRISEVKKKVLAEILTRCTAPTFRVEALEGFTTAMATAGGVDLAGVDPKTMQSRLVPGLYFAGEVLDIDGDSGGYNIQAACSTGMLAGKSAALAGC